MARKRSVLTNEVHMPLAGCPPGKQRYVKVIKTEEKGSDVNMATHLLRDAFREEAEAFVLVTNHSDLLEPVRIVRNERSCSRRAVAAPLPNWPWLSIQGNFAGGLLAH